MENRPWGNFDVIRSFSDCKVKMINVDVGQQLSYQYHHHREEHWIIVSGYGEFTLNDVVTEVKAGDHVHIGLKDKHRIKNIGYENLRFIEVQLGESFEEEDIVRLQDNYGRTD